VCYGGGRQMLKYLGGSSIIDQERIHSSRRIVFNIGDKKT
jgi:hypothetical protein